MSAIELVKGQNSPLPAGDLLITVRVAAAVDLSALSVTGRGKVRSDEDFVFYNHPVGQGVRLIDGPDGPGSVLAVATGRIPAEIEEIRAVVTLDDQNSTFGQVPAPVATVADGAGNTLARFRIGGLGKESVVIALELYRRDRAWKVRAVGQGYSGGFAALVTDHGIVVDDDPAVTSAVPAAAYSAQAPSIARPVHAGPVPPPRALTPSGAGHGAAPTPHRPSPGPVVRTVPGEQRLSLDKRRELNLRKQTILTVLSHKGAPTARARVVLVIDKTGSMSTLYRIGAVHRVVHRMIPVAIQLDDDGRLEPYLYAKSFAALPAITVDTADQWCDTYLHMSGRRAGIDYSRIGGVNNEIPIMREIMTTLDPDSDSTLVLFFTDGGFHEKRKITELMREAATLPIFWQFVGLGAANYGLLRDLDTMDGRVVDNAGFFAIDDIDRVADEELYGRLLGEFPDWLRAATAAGILR